LNERGTHRPWVTVVGFLVPLIALGGIAIAILLSPNFSWVDNALSDLGHWTRTDIGPHPFPRALIFNLGLVMTGLLLTLRTLSFMTTLRDRLSVVALVPFLLATGFLTAIGVFSEDTGLRIGEASLHYLASLGFFSTFPLAMWFMGLIWLRCPRVRWFSVISLVLPGVSIVLWWGTFSRLFPWRGIAIPELVTALTAIAWFWLFLRLMREPLQQSA
jgi:hypothetical membrane protein